MMFYLALLITALALAVCCHSGELPGAQRLAGCI